MEFRDDLAIFLIPWAHFGGEDNALSIALRDAVPEANTEDADWVHPQADSANPVLLTNK
ncbi:MAG: hypothetical protein J0H02_04910 [Armatimonadetes bacterium]|nr:hypothetical protein [Armatimonadota bacterium]